MYLTAFTHYSFVKLIPMLSNGRFIPFFLFEIFGILALFVSFLLFATSNDISMKKLGVWWYRLHRLVYPGMIFILLHLALMRFSVWTILMITLTISFVTSTLYEKLKSKKE
jgi:DMSO/TMAO reductase YedYZ heme-binding membrane subunit